MHKNLLRIIALFSGVFFISGCNVVNPKPDNVASFVVLTDTSTTELSLFDTAEYSRTRLINVYDALTSKDENLEIIPALATGWGRLADNTWEFTIRPNVKFSDGTPLELEDILYSFRVAEESALSSLLENIAQVEISENQKILITTKNTDPMLPYKVSKVFVVPQESPTTPLPVGTGAYVIEQVEPDFILAKNPNYWGEAPLIEKAYFATGDRLSRTNAAKNDFCGLYTHSLSGSTPCGIIASLPAETENTNENLEDYLFSNLATTFVIFNQYSDKMQSTHLKQSLRLALDKYKLSNVAGSGFRPATQFISSGVTGYDPSIKIPSLDTTAIDQVLYLDYLSGFEPIANMLTEEFKAVNVNLITTPVSSLEELETRTKNGDNDLFVLSWQIDSGDAEEFFTQIVHSQDSNYGGYNFFGYSDYDTDRLIEEAETMLDSSDRLSALREISHIMTLDDIYGIPLFEQVRLQLTSAEYSFTARADGLINLKNLTQK